MYTILWRKRQINVSNSSSSLLEALVYFEKWRSSSRPSTSLGQAEVAMDMDCRGILVTMPLLMADQIS